MNKKALKTTVKKMVPAVSVAMIATALGFFSLYTSPVPMIKDFGTMLAIGVVISFIVALLILIPALFIRDQIVPYEKKEKPKQNKRSPFRVLTRWIIKLRFIILAVALILSALGLYYDLDAPAETDIETFMPQDLPALEDLRTLRDAVGTTDQISILYEADDVWSDDTMAWLNETEGVLQAEFSEDIVKVNHLASMLGMMEEMNTESDVTTSASLLPESQINMFIDEENNIGTMTLGIRYMEAEEKEVFLAELTQTLSTLDTEGIDTTITGRSVLDNEMVDGLTSGRFMMTLVGMALVFLALLILYRHVIKALIPLIPIVLIVGWSGLVMYLFDMSYTPITATLGALVIGIGTEFTILIMERYMEEREKGHLPEAAIIIANEKIGQAIFVSVVTTLAGFSALLFSDFVILNNFGMMTVVNISFAFLSTVIVMPVILLLFDPLFIKKQN